jgi:hypothetical protein
MSMETNHPSPHGTHGSGGVPGAGYEQRDASIPALLKFGFWMAVVIVVTMVAMKYTFNYMDRTQTVSPSATATAFVRPRELPPSPRLQAEPRQELRDYCAAQERELNTYGWVDQRLRVVHIPINQAMDLVLKNGLPIRASAPTGAAAVPVPPAMSAGGADLQGPCAYATGEGGDDASAGGQAAELGKVGP